MSTINTIQIINKDNQFIKFEDSHTKKYFEPHANELINSLSTLMGERLHSIWFDVGNVIYDLHMEIIFEDSDESIDLYLEIKDGDLRGLYLSNGITLRSTLGPILTNKLIEATRNAKACLAN